MNLQRSISRRHLSMGSRPSADSLPDSHPASLRGSHEGASTIHNPIWC